MDSATACATSRTRGVLARPGSGVRLAVWLQGALETRAPEWSARPPEGPRDRPEAWAEPRRRTTSPPRRGARPDGRLRDRVPSAAERRAQSRSPGADDRRVRQPRSPAGESVDSRPHDGDRDIGRANRDRRPESDSTTPVPSGLGVRLLVAELLAQGRTTADEPATGEAAGRMRACARPTRTTWRLRIGVGTEDRSLRGRTWTWVIYAGTIADPVMERCSAGRRRTCRCPIEPSCSTRPRHASRRSWVKPPATGTSRRSGEWVSRTKRTGTSGTGATSRDFRSSAAGAKESHDEIVDIRQDRSRTRRTCGLPPRRLCMRSVLLVSTPAARHDRTLLTHPGQ